MNRKTILNAIEILLQRGSRLIHFDSDNGTTLIDRDENSHELSFTDFSDMKDHGFLRFVRCPNIDTTEFRVTMKARLFLESEKTVKEAALC